MNEETTATTPTYVVKYAVYGGTTPSYESSAADVSAELQQLLDDGAVQLCICNGFPSPNPGVGPYPVFEDPAPGYDKGFAAIVTVDGVDQYFACAQGGTIDFSVQPQNLASPVLQLGNLQIAYAPTNQYVFGPCSYVLTNNTAGAFPAAGASAWVSVDFYLTTSTTETPTAANKIGDMACQIVPNPLPVGAQQTVTASSQDLFNISRMLEQNTSIGPARGTTCYVFATMRRPSGRILLSAGSFSSAFTYQGVQPLTPVGV